jgi:hypothetical protein
MREDRATHSTTEMNQRSFASAEYAMKKKRTRREKFLVDMERVVPWSRLIAVIEPLYPTSGRVGRQPIGVPRMLRMYCLQQWCGLADEAPKACLSGFGAIEAEPTCRRVPTAIPSAPNERAKVVCRSAKIGPLARG